jgi:hypothetical protein
MKPVNLAAQLAAAETELTYLKMALAQVKEDRDDWRRAAEKLYACAKKLEEADEVQCASPEHRAW